MPLAAALAASPLWHPLTVAEKNVLFHVQVIVFSIKQHLYSIMYRKLYSIVYHNLYRYSLFGHVINYNSVNTFYIFGGMRIYK